MKPNRDVLKNRSKKQKSTDSYKKGLSVVHSIYTLSLSAMTEEFEMCIYKWFFLSLFFAACGMNLLNTKSFIHLFCSISTTSHSPQNPTKKYSLPPHLIYTRKHTECNTSGQCEARYRELPSKDFSVFVDCIKQLKVQSLSVIRCILFFICTVVMCKIGKLIFLTISCISVYQKIKQFSKQTTMCQKLHA